MSVQQKILLACTGFLAIIALLGGLAQRQASQMGRLAIDIYDHALMGVSYVDQTQEEFLRLVAAHHTADATLAGETERAELQKVLERLDVALERASSERTRAAGVLVRSMLAALPGAPAGELEERMAKADRAITKLVKKFASDGLEARDDADELAIRSSHLVLIEIAVAVCLALGVGLMLGRNLSRPLVQLVGTIRFLSAGELEHEVGPRLLRRRDEIGAVARATAVFREAMQQNLRVGREREQDRATAQVEKHEEMRNAADKIELETSEVAGRSKTSSSVLAGRAQDLAASAARVMTSVGSVAEASAEALERSEAVAAAGEQLSESARVIAVQITDTATEIASTALAGARAGKIIEQLSSAVGQIGAIARLIGDIAKRTNLLALNATIEAARAGEAGRGFAVVASEVKMLATQTARSTDEIARNTGAIQQATRDAVQVVNEMVERIASIESITRAVAAATERQTVATNDIASNVAGTTEAMRVVARQITLVTDEVHSTGAAVSEILTLAGTVGDNMAELRSVVVRIVRTSSIEADRREDERVTIDVPAMLILDGREVPATCLNLSRGGARVRSQEPLTEGCSVTLRLPGLPELPAQVLQGGMEGGLRFTWEPEDAPAELCKRIDQLAAA
jgi:methyl-accepting chemotaxis protein